MLCLSVALFVCAHEQREMDERENYKLDFDSALRKVRTEQSTLLLLAAALCAAIAVGTMDASRHVCADLMPSLLHVHAPHLRFVSSVLSRPATSSEPPSSVAKLRRLCGVMSRYDGRRSCSQCAWL